MQKCAVTMRCWSKIDPYLIAYPTKTNATYYAESTAELKQARPFSAFYCLVISAAALYFVYKFSCKVNPFHIFKATEVVRYLNLQNNTYWTWNLEKIVVEINSSDPSEKFSPTDNSRSRAVHH